LRSRRLVWWHILLFLLAAEGAVYLAAREAAGYWQRAAEREFTAVACCRQEVDKVPYAALINRWAGAENLNARLVASVIRAESSFQPRAVSHAGARGLMQVAPGTWTATCVQHGTVEHSTWS